MTLRCGIIGAGRIAWKYDAGRWDGMRSVSHASCIDRHPQATLCALVDPIAAARDDFKANGPYHSGIAVCDHLDDFFAQNLDLVIVASPSEHHAADISKCFDHHIDRILVEKPVTLDLPAFQELRGKANNLPYTPRVVVNFFRRFLPQFHRLKQQLQNKIGATAVHITYSRTLQTNGVHLLDIIGFLFDQTQPPPLEWHSAHDPQNPSFGLTIDGVPITVTGQDLPYHALDVRITDDRGRLSAVRGGMDLLWEPKEDNPDYPGFYHLALPKPLPGYENAARHMRDGTYLALCNLIDDSGPSHAPLDSAYFSQALMTQVMP